MARRPRGTCPVCRTTRSLDWSGDVRVLRRHGSGDAHCPGSGRPAVEELGALPAPRPDLVPVAVDDPRGFAPV
jgi:hypothetical protein